MSEQRKIEKIAVVGAGIMACGIAQAAAQRGFSVILAHSREKSLQAGFSKIEARLEKWVAADKLPSIEKGLILSHITTTGNLEECKDAGLVIEAIIEREEVKKEIFKTLDSICAPQTIFATNTSSISINRLAEDTARPERFIGMHFMNPAYTMTLVEVVRGSRTAEETVQATVWVAEQMGKTPVVVNDSPGFVANRVLMPMINDAIYCLEEGVATSENIDAIMKLGAHHPMGPLELADFIGLDTCLAILEVLHQELGEKYKPCDLLRQMVADGKLGRKSGQGFYEYK